jgi:hypothetical protein
MLAWLHRKSENPAVTSKACYWKKPTLAVLEGMNVPVSELIKSKFKYTVSPAFANQRSFLEEMKSTLGLKSYKSMFSIQFHPRLHPFSVHILSIDYFKSILGVAEPSFEDFWQFMLQNMSTTLVPDIEVKTRGQSTSPLWFEMRYCRITASAFNACACAGRALATPIPLQEEESSLEGDFILDMEDLDDAEHYAVAKLFGAKKVKQNAAMKHGLAMEEPALRCLSSKLKVAITSCGTFLSKTHPFISASPDGLSKDFIVEVKSPTKISAISSYLLRDGKTPERKVLAQMLLQMWTTSKHKGYLVVVKPEFKVNPIYTNLIVNEVVFKDYEKVFESLLCSACLFYEKKIFPKLMNCAKSFKKT